jgi:hypothetical protein
MSGALGAVPVHANPTTREELEGRSRDSVPRTTVNVRSVLGLDIPKVWMGLVIEHWFRKAAVRSCKRPHSQHRDFVFVEVRVTSLARRYVWTTKVSFTTPHPSNQMLPEQKGLGLGLLLLCWLGTRKKGTPRLKPRKPSVSANMSISTC